jgi:Zn-finger nucleic acid-binding protein
MVVVPAPLPTPRVRVEVCPSCQFFWFDPGELEALPPAPASATPKDE